MLQAALICTLISQRPKESMVMSLIYISIFIWVQRKQLFE